MAAPSGMKSAAIGRSDVFHIPVHQIHVKDGWNVREMGTEDNQTALRELVDSIKEIGVQEPLTGYFDGEHVYLTDGHRRLEATLIAIDEGAPIEYLKVKSEGRGSNEADRVASMLVRNSGKPLTPWEQSKVVKRLVNYGWETRRIANTMGKSTSYVTQLLNLQTAPEDIQQMVRQDVVAAGIAAQVSKTASGVETLRKLKEKADQEGKAKVATKDIKTAILAPQLKAANAEGERMLAAACYLLAAALPDRYLVDGAPPGWWPFDMTTFTPGDPANALRAARGMLANVDEAEVA